MQKKPTIKTITIKSRDQPVRRRTLQSNAMSSQHSFCIVSQHKNILYGQDYSSQL